MKFYTVSHLSERHSESPEGFLIVRDTVIARTGLQFYHNDELPMVTADGNGWITVERDPEQVFRPESIASFEGKPLTNDHPTDMVGPRNWDKLAIGVVTNV